MLELFFHRSAKVLLISVAAFSLLSLTPTVVQSLAPAAATADETVYACGSQAGTPVIFNGGSAGSGINIIDYCGAQDDSIQLINPDVTVAPGVSSSLIANAPAGLMIEQATISPISLDNTSRTGYVAYMLWTGGQQRVDGGNGYTNSWTPAGVNGFGFSLGCAGPSKCPGDGAYVMMNNVELVVAETVNPALVFNAGSLWYQGSVGDPNGARWVRGTWPLGFSASSPSGIASMAVSISGTGETVGGPAWPGCWPDGSGLVLTNWTECDNGQNWTPTVALSGDGDQQLAYLATAAAQNVGSQSETIHVDTVQPTVTLSGPSDASSAAGTQFVTATAHVGPSGLGSISCSVDGGPAQSFTSSPAQIPVSGLGPHLVRCTASNRSINPQGQVAVSTPATFSIDIGEPTASGISFASIVHSLKCRKVRERETVAPRWIDIRRHGKLVKVHRRAYAKRVQVVKCRARITKRKVTELVKVKRHGHIVVVKRTKVERVVLPPQVVNVPTKRVAYGQGTTVSGFLGTPSGVALAGRAVAVMTAPNNSLGQWTQAAAVTTAANGTWTAELPPGPSRLVEATYAGDSTTLPSTSATAHLVVPARLKIDIAPRSTRWGGTITISGRVLGGYIPGGKLLRLRIGVEGLRSTVGIPSVGRHGRFRTTWTFSAGRGVVHYWFSVSTLDEADYPFAPASSRRVYIRVGPG